MEELYSSVANLGFPIAVSIYLLVRIEGKLNTLTQSINELFKGYNFYEVRKHLTLEGDCIITKKIIMQSPIVIGCHINCSSLEPNICLVYNGRGEGVKR